ncbi:hypothetical protein [Lacticaseibacillus suibinensis]|uniref:hypothetical protein n=1 Tax=Lacticaseibacillus suibinensis TaxID=2486011 RepID=UPI000F782DD3|nr:hypothetical protein [Lacticaseibacillus suibinensis]
MVTTVDKVFLVLYALTAAVMFYLAGVQFGAAWFGRYSDTADIWISLLWLVPAFMALAQLGREVWRLLGLRAKQLEK